MNEVVDRAIRLSGEMWSETADRTKSPVLIAFGTGPVSTCYELTLPQGEGHPFWRVNERVLTEAERAELLREVEGRGVMALRLDALIPLENREKGTNYYRVDYFVKNGRRPEWSVGGSWVKVTVEEVD